MNQVISNELWRKHVGMRVYKVISARGGRVLARGIEDRWNGSEADFLNEFERVPDQDPVETFAQRKDQRAAGAWTMA